MPGRSRVPFGLHCVFNSDRHDRRASFRAEAGPARFALGTGVHVRRHRHPTRRRPDWRASRPDLFVSSLSGWQGSGPKVRDQATRALPARTSALAGDAAPARSPYKPEPRRHADGGHRPARRDHGSADHARRRLAAVRREPGGRRHDRHRRTATRPDRRDGIPVVNVAIPATAHPLIAYSGIITPFDGANADTATSPVTE